MPAEGQDAEGEGVAAEPAEAGDTEPTPESDESQPELEPEQDEQEPQAEPEEPEAEPDEPGLDEPETAEPEPDQADLRSPEPAEPERVEPAPGEPGSGQAAFVLLLAVLAVIHSLVIGLFLLPSGPVRQAAGSGRLSSYVDPYFEQAWDRMEPNAQAVDEALQFRVQVDTGRKKPVTSDWTDVTRVENRALRHDLDPARIHDAARRLATNLNQVMFLIGQTGRDQVLSNFVDRNPDQVPALLAQEGVSVPSARSYGVVESMALRYTSLYAQAVEKRPIVSLQIRVGRRTAPGHAAGKAARVTDLDFQWFVTGWRRLYRGSEDARASFAAYVSRSAS